MCFPGGGGGGSGTQKYEWNDTMGDYWRENLGRARNEVEKGYQQYGKQRIAGLSTDQTDAMAGIRNYVGAPGDFLYGKGNLQAQDTLAGTYLDGDKKNPYAGPNVYMGTSNPMFEDFKSRGMDAITDKYQNAIAPQLSADAVMNGTFGGGDHQKVVANAQQGLAKSLGDYSSGMDNDQYNRSANLYEGYANRGAQSYDAERNRMMGAVGASQADQGLTLQRYNAQMGIGDINRSLGQDYLNQDYTNWQEQQNFGRNAVDYMTGIMSRAQGGMSPNSTTTLPGYGASPYSQILGTGLAAYGLLK